MLNDSDRIAELEAEVAEWKQKAIEQAAQKQGLGLLVDSLKHKAKSANYCPSCAWLLPNHDEACGRYTEVVRRLKEKNLRLSEQLGRCVKALEKITDSQWPESTADSRHIANTCLTSLSKG